MADIELQGIRETALRLSAGVRGLKRRHFLSKLALNREPRIKVLRGFRGVGKTTALLQLVQDNSIYFSMDNPGVRMHSLYDVGKKCILDGSTLLLIDEAHHYADWKKDTKALYDEFPNIAIIVSGSAPLAFEPERRYEIINAAPLSLQEFIELGGRTMEATESWKDADRGVEFLANHPELYEAYGEYTGGGAFPTYFSYKEKTLESIYNSISKSIREDAIFLPNVDGEMTVQMERTLSFLATSSLGEFSINGLSKTLSFPKNKTYYMVGLLEGMNILKMVKPYGRGAKLVRGEPKLLFYHPVLRKALCGMLGFLADAGALREEMAVFSLLQRGWKISTIKGMKKSPDYIIEKGSEKFVVEVGGASKNKSQLKGFREKTLLLSERQLILLGLF